MPSDALLADLCSRFILHCPEEELASIERLLFLVEPAHWFYEDFCRTGEGKKLSSFSLRDFAELMFSQHPSLEHHKACAPPHFSSRCSTKAVCRFAWTTTTSASRSTRHGLRGCLAEPG
jgi:hypothetical protein